MTALVFATALNTITIHHIDNADTIYGIAVALKEFLVILAVFYTTYQKT